jgi:hypothetical protein
MRYVSATMYAHRVLVDRVDNHRRVSRARRESMMLDRVALAIAPRVV